MTGYWWPPPPGTRWRPTDELVDFLTAGPPPVLVGFGSMASDRTSALGAAVTEALARTGHRAVVQRGWAGLEAGEDDDVLVVDDVPHEWLMPRVAAVVHHAGAGTTAAALRAGVPSVPVPHAHDQPFWARRLVGLGAAPGGPARRRAERGDRRAGAPSPRRAARGAPRRRGRRDAVTPVSRHLESALVDRTRRRRSPRGTGS